MVKHTYLQFAALNFQPLPNFTWWEVIMHFCEHVQHCCCRLLVGQWSSRSPFSIANLLQSAKVWPIYSLIMEMIGTIFWVGTKFQTKISLGKQDRVYFMSAFDHGKDPQKGISVPNINDTWKKMVNSFIFPFDHGNGSLNNRSKMYTIQELVLCCMWK